MMDLSRFYKEPPHLDTPDVPEREDEDKLPPTPTPSVPTPPACITARYLPSINVWIAGEWRSEPYCWELSATGQFADVKHPKVRSAEGRQDKWHVLAVANSMNDALRVAERRKSIGE